jgi:hypothetical protein
MISESEAVKLLAEVFTGIYLRGKAASLDDLDKLAAFAESKAEPKREVTVDEITAAMIADGEHVCVSLHSGQFCMCKAAMKVCAPICAETAMRLLKGE